MTKAPEINQSEAEPSSLWRYVRLIDACHWQWLSLHPDTFWRRSPDISFSRGIKVKLYLFMSFAACRISAVMFIVVSCVILRLVRRRAARLLVVKQLFHTNVSNTG